MLELPVAAEIRRACIRRDSSVQRVVVALSQAGDFCCAMVRRVGELQVRQSPRRFWPRMHIQQQNECLLFLLFTRYRSFFHHRQLATFGFCMGIGTGFMAVSALGTEPNYGTYMIMSTSRITPCSIDSGRFLSDGSSLSPCSSSL
jgi:hypothetical protein